jgi:hypothetical protein
VALNKSKLCEVISSTETKLSASAYLPVVLWLVVLESELKEVVRLVPIVCPER